MAAATAVLSGVIAACGSSSSSSSSTAGKEGGTITIGSGTPPLSADQGLDFTAQGTELYSVINTPLLTFVRVLKLLGHLIRQITNDFEAALELIIEYAKRKPEFTGELTKFFIDSAGFDFEDESYGFCERF